MYSNSMTDAARPPLPTNTPTPDTTAEPTSASILEAEETALLEQFAPAAEPENTRAWEVPGHTPPLIQPHHALAQEETINRVATTRRTTNLTTSSTSEQASPALIGAVLGGIALITTVFIGGWWWQSRAASGGPEIAASPSPIASTQPSSAPVVALNPAPTTLPSPSPKSSPSTKPSVSPSLKASPTPTATPSSTNTAVDLSVEEIKIMDSQNGVLQAEPYYAGQRVTVRARLRNNGTQDSGTFSSNWTINGTTVGANGSGKVKKDSEAIYDDVNSLTYGSFPLRAGDNIFVYVVDSANVLKESNRGNNTRMMTINAGATRSDLEAVEIKFYEQNTTTLVTTPAAGQALTARATYKNSGGDTQTQFSLKIFLNTIQLKEKTITSYINPGQTVEEADGYNFTAATGSSEFRMDLNTVNPFPETSFSNNSKTVTLTI